MSTTFQAVNAPISPAQSVKEEFIASPTTPKPTSKPLETATKMSEDVTTPTRANFVSSALASQKPLPSLPFPDSIQLPEITERRTPARENSQQSSVSKQSDDVDMGESDKDGGVAGDDAAASDDESSNADGTRPNKKKKSQRFYCQDYPPCNLSFTRSEHLARHIRSVAHVPGTTRLIFANGWLPNRKHTGERPFQCHCSRRFSRLDNLRQHAQTVHVNEDIPGDSLALTGTRFQRQIRTERVRQVGARSRPSPGGTVGPAGRGHGKSLSTSSIASVSSVGSAYSANEARRRPPPLVMADPRSRLSLESYRNADAQYYRPASPSDFSTPTSATFSTGHSSPRWGSGVASPVSSHSRSQSMYTDSQTPNRRLSVPSGGNPFQSPHGTSVRGPLYTPGSMNSSNSAAFSPGQTSLLASPTISTAGWSRRDATSSAADEAWRRRTWHPDTRDYNGASRLSQVVSSSQFSASIVPPPFASPKTNQAGQPQPTLRLPGIESFDAVPHRHHRPMTPPNRNPSPMLIDSEDSRAVPALLSVAEIAPVKVAEPRIVAGVTGQWDMSLHRGLTRLGINTPPRDSAGAWANEVNQAVMARAEQARTPHPVAQSQAQPAARFGAVATPVQPAQHAVASHSSRHHHTMSAPSITGAREFKRHGWCHGPTTSSYPARDAIPEGRAHVDRIIHPNVAQFQGFPAREQLQQSPVIHQHLKAPTSERQAGAQTDAMRRLEALVAVATGEGSAAAAY